MHVKCIAKTDQNTVLAAIIRHSIMWCGLPVKEKLLVYSPLNLCRHKFKVVNDTTVDLTLLQHHKLHVCSYLQNTQEAEFIIF